VSAASASLASNAIDDEYLSRAQKLVPTELIGAFDANPPATTRLLQSWTYVNQAPFSERHNLRAFLRGDRPNWGLIAAHEYFVRDLEEDLYNDTLDFATTSSVRPVVDLLLGPAGFGVTTLLLSTAVRLVQERAGMVFYLRPGAHIMEGDIEFATSISPEQRTFFFVDDAGDHRREVEAATQRLKALGRPAMMVLGSRLNEWRQLSGSPIGKEYELEELSDPEIERLIAYLARHDELGQLTPLSPALRTAAIRSKHGKQLLVAMREVTEGPGFDAIIEDEFRKLGSDISQRAYLAVCAFYQHGVYVLQHYARMLAREKKWELALSQIDSAIKLKPKVRVLYHTKGKILAAMTSATESEDIARRRLVQSEAAFQQGLKMLNSDEYCLQGLAELYLDWAKRASTAQEGTDYIAKAEGIITDGLRVVRSREALRIVSAQIAQWLGNRPDHVKALETAVKESPHSIVARYLLGRTYRRGGDPEKARQTLESLVQEHPEEVRACVELAKTLLDLNEPREKAIAVLRLSTLHGYSDPRFIATLGGMLFLNGQFTEADEVFEKSVTLGLAPGDLHRVEFKPRDASDSTRPLRLCGKVAAVKNGYALIDVQGYPRVISPGAKWFGTPMRRDLPVEFKIVFSPKGAVADEPTAMTVSSET
jgi:tetratricopeptide (TPR) repeat protein